MQTLTNETRFITYSHPDETTEIPNISDFYIGVFECTDNDDPRNGKLAIFVGEDDAWITEPRDMAVFLQGFHGCFAADMQYVPEEARPVG